MVKCTSPGCSKEQYHLGLCTDRLRIENKRRVIQRNKLAPTYGLDRNGKPYENPRYKFYANGDIDGDHWMCVHKPTGLVFAVPFAKPDSNVPISQLVYMAFPGFDSEEVNDFEVNEDSHDKTDAEEREGGANILVDLQLSLPVVSKISTYSLDDLFNGIQYEVAMQAKKRLYEHLIDPDTIFHSFDTIQPDIRERIAQLVLYDIDRNTFAYQIVECRLHALM